MSKKATDTVPPIGHPSVLLYQTGIYGKCILLIFLWIIFWFITHISQEILLKSCWSKMSIIYQIMKAVCYLGYQYNSFGAPQSLSHLILLALLVDYAFVYWCQQFVTVHFVSKCMKTLFSWLHDGVLVYGKT